MSAQPATRRGAVASALAAARAWLIEPAVPLEQAPAAELDARPVVLVVGLAPGCGASVVARALAAELGARDPGRAAAVAVANGGGSLALGTHAAARLARTLSNLAEGRARALGRLCVVEGAEPEPLAGALRYLAPLVLESDVGGRATAALAALADRVVLVGGSEVEPALAAVVRDSIADCGPAPLVVANRCAGEGDWAGCDLALPESRIGAQLAFGGREPRGELGGAIRELADRCEAR